MENKFVIANLKMNMTMAEVKNYLNILDGKIKTDKVIICPSNIYIPYFIFKKIKVGVQNLCSGISCTGEISPYQTSSMGIKYAILGHSERRNYFNETDLDINKKIVESIKYGIIPILCIGETEEEKQMLKTSIVLKRQLKNALIECNLKKVLIAYEPVWAIGSKIIPSNNEIQKTVDYIKATVKELYKTDIKVLYGGSIDEYNIKELVNITNLDGFLVGASSVDANKLLNIIEVVEYQ